MNLSRLVSSPWWRAPLLLARRPGVVLALGLAGVVAVLPAATAPLFVSAAQTATLHRQITSDCAGRSGATIVNKALGDAARLIRLHDGVIEATSEPIA